MTDETLQQLYSRQIMALATDIAHLGTLDAPDARAKKRSPLCGSTVTAELTLAEGRVHTFAQTVRACALGQASAAVLGQVVIGADRATLAAGRAALIEMLTGSGALPPPPFEALKALHPARDYKNRHPSILLAWEAALAAFDEAASAKA